MKSKIISGISVAVIAVTLLFGPVTSSLAAETDTGVEANGQEMQIEDNVQKEVFLQTEEEAPGDTTPVEGEEGETDPEPEKKVGWITDEETGEKCFFDEEGNQVFGWKDIDGGRFFFDKTTGIMQSDWFKDPENNEWYYLGSDGNMVKNDWTRDSIGWMWMGENGTTTKGKWLQINNKWYYFKANGYMQTGWLQIKNKWYYLGTANDGIMKSGWQKISNKWYYFGTANDGVMKSGWQKISNKWYYLGTANDGIMKSGWQKISNKWYYFGTANDGVMKSGWQKISNKWYYFGTANDGVMKSGWQKISNKWYYLGTANDGVMKTGWQKVGGYYYYMNSSGVMQSGKVVDGYKLAANGSNKTKVLVQDIVKAHTTNAMTNDQKIKALWNWMMSNSWTYTRTYEHTSSSWVWYTGWTDDFANQLITNGTGNCFRYSAGLGYMIKEATGYKVNVYHGMTPAARGGVTPHGWITVNIGGTLYAYDPDLNKFGSSKSIYYKTSYSTTKNSIHLQGTAVALY